MKHILLLFLLSLSTFAQITNVNVGTAANDNTGDTLRVAFQRLNTSIAYIDTNKATAFSTGTGVTNVSAVLSANITAGSNITFTTNSNGAIAIAAASGSSVSVNGAAVSSPNLTNSATLTFSVSGSNVSAHPTNLTAAQLSTDSVSADELNATGVESELEAVLDLQDMQGAVTDAQVPNNITVDLATTATTANSGDSATAFFSSGEIEDARLPAAITRDTEWDTIAEIETATGANIITVGELDGTANWTAEGTTNSTLSGEARVHNLVATNAVTVGASGTLGWSDVLLNRDAANTLALRNGTSAQALRVYNTFTDASNNESIGVYWSGNIGFVGTEEVGSGVTREVRIISPVGSAGFNAISFGTASTAKWAIRGDGHLFASTDNTYDIGASGATRPRDLFLGRNLTVGGSATVTSGQVFQWQSRGSLGMSADGVLAVYNAAQTDFNRLQFGGTTASFPALKRSATQIDLRLADDSDYAPFRCNGGRFRNIDIAYTAASSLNILADTGTLTLGASSDVVLRRGGAAATLQLGTDAASATPQKIKALNGSGTDIAGSSLTLAGGQSTGTGRGGDVVVQTSPSSATGSSANAYSTRAYKSAKAVVLTETTATTIANITCASAKYIGGTAIITVFATDATDHQARTLRLSFSAVNKAGTVTAAIDTPNESIAASAGTLTATITAVANGNSVDLKVDATSSLTQTTLEASWALEINGSDVATVTAQ